MDGTPHRSRLLVALLCAALLAVTLAPVAARADDNPAARWPTGGSTLHLLLAMGADHWGMTPCGGKVSIRWGTLDPSLNAQSSWVNPVDDFGQPSRNSDCQVTLSTATTWDWPKLCTVVIHEIGHLDGHDHVADPTDIMYFSYVQPAPECAAMAEPAETGVPAAPRAAATPPKKPARVAKAKVVKKKTRAKRRR
ncbi:matrixin family metalloprotease [Conexibacter woesei]|uniref:matrixin family metalloprotease n=1 Tax=Conexibacter woesei TaxID=191495 RepID=UPI000403847E|nr:matrixin family metalloprotease [Conexibacter woesei]